MSSSEILEQKRRRLAELRARRAENAVELAVLSHRTDEPKLESKGPLQNELHTASIAVQTLPRATANLVRALAPLVPISTEVSAYSKAVQTDKLQAVIEPKRVQNTQKKIEEPLEIEVADEVKLNEELALALEALKSWALAGVGSFLKKSENSPISTEGYMQPPLGRRPLVLLASHSVEGSFVVLMSTKDSSTNSSSFYSDFPGFAVLFKYVNGTVIVRACLASTSELSCVKLDQFNPNKVLGGLKNGRVCVWDLTDARAEAIVLPQLTSPGVFQMGSVESPKKSRSKTAVILPKKPISALCQFAYDTSMVVAFSQDGVINAWSTNFLLSPKHRSVQLIDETISGSLLDNYLPISSVVVCEDGTAGEDNEEGKHLDSVLVSSGHTVLSLTNTAARNFIEKSYGSPISKPANPIHSIQLVGSYEDTPIFISANSGCLINVYRMNLESPVLMIPARGMVMALASRPSHPFEFIASCYVNQTSTSLQASVSLWNLAKDITSPAYKVEIECNESMDYVNSIDFDASGDLVYVSFHSGRIEVWSIDDNKLAQQENETIFEWLKNY